MPKLSPILPRESDILLTDVHGAYRHLVEVKNRVLNVLDIPLCLVELRLHILG